MVIKRMYRLSEKITRETLILLAFANLASRKLDITYEKWDVSVITNQILARRASRKNGVERKLKNCEEILSTLKGMNFASVGDQYFLPLYKRETIMDDLDTASKFKTDYQFITNSQMKSIQKIRVGVNYYIP